MNLEEQSILDASVPKLYLQYPLTYNSWKGMKERCNNPKHRMFSYYGGRGIKVCRRWLRFKEFLMDMGIKPQGLQIDRIDPEKGYEPANCRWVTSSQNNANRRPFSSTGFKNVAQRPSGRFVAHIRKDGVRTVIGTYDTAEEAARAHDMRSIEIYGEYSKLNYPRKDYEN